MTFEVHRHTSKLERVPRAARACVVCHARKVRCDLSTTRSQCSNCQRDGQQCEPRLQQRRSHQSRATSTWRSPLHNSRETLPDRASTAPTGDKEQPEETGTSGSPQPPTTNPLPRWPGTKGSLTEDSDAQPAADPSPASESVTSVASAYENGYMERSSYIAPDRLQCEDGSNLTYNVNPPSNASKKMAELVKALEFPPRAIRDGLFEKFWTYCYPWDPIIERSQVIGVPLERVSPILLQAIFLAGSRMSTSSLTYASSQEFYNRAKTLFWIEDEPDPLIVLTAVQLLHWWNPHGPERVSTNTSSFWCRIAVSLAQQMGLHSQKRPVLDESLRRRLWWSLVARDSLISVAHGRPPAINLDDCDVSRPTVEDFPNAPLTGQVFVAYVDLSVIMGRFTKHILRKTPSGADMADIENSLYRWLKRVPNDLRLPPMTSCHDSNHALRPYSFDVRQVQILYLVTVILLYRSQTLEGPFPWAAVLSASMIAGLFEDFLARDEVRHLGPMFTFHLLAAAIALLSCYKYPGLWALAEQDLKVIRQAQDEMKNKWPSAIGSLHSFERMYKITITTQKRETGLPEFTLEKDQAMFFEDFDMSLCRVWNGFLQKPSGAGEASVAAAHAGGPVMAFNNNSSSAREPTSVPSSMLHMVHTEPGLPQLQHSMVAADQMGALDEVMNFDTMFQDEAGQMNGGIGEWLTWDMAAFMGN